jgi:hypothetical protein
VVNGLCFVFNLRYNLAAALVPPCHLSNDTDHGTGAVPFKADNMIKNVKQYQELASMVEMAEENQGTLRFGAHYALKAYLKKNFSVVTGDNRDTIRKARQLLDEFLTAYTSED